MWFFPLQWIIWYTLHSFIPSYNDFSWTLTFVSFWMKHVVPLIWPQTFDMTYLNDTSGTFAPQVLKQTHLLAKFRSRLSHKLFSCLFSFSNVQVKDPNYSMIAVQAYWEAEHISIIPHCWSLKKSCELTLFTAAQVVQYSQGKPLVKLNTLWYVPLQTMFLHYCEEDQGDAHWP